MSCIPCCLALTLVIPLPLCYLTRRYVIYIGVPVAELIADGAVLCCAAAVDEWASFMKGHGVQHVISLLTPSELETYGEQLVPKLQQSFDCAAFDPKDPSKPVWTLLDDCCVLCIMVV